MNEIRITATLSLDEKYPDDAYIDLNLSVDGQYLHEVNVYIDPVALVNSTTMSGEFFIYTCDCGNATCQGIDDGVMVSQTPDTVIWRLKNPISWPPNEPKPDWAHDAEFKFAKDAYVQQVSTALEHAKRLARGYKGADKLWVGPALSFEGLMALELTESSSFFAHEPDTRSVH